MGSAIDLTGETFGRLFVERRVENSIHNAAQYLCKCDCGNEIVVNSNNLRTGHTKSCGCKRKESTSKWLKKYNFKHGMCGSRLYIVWAGMKQRVENPNNERYKDYGARGIKICKEWHDFETFKKWAYENGYKDDAKYGDCTIDRKDVDGDYEPNNCRWVDLLVQAHNKRPKKELEVKK